MVSATAMKTPIAETPPTLEDWKQLYAAAIEFHQLEPWKWMYDEDVFGVKDPVRGEPLTVNRMRS